MSENREEPKKAEAFEEAGAERRPTPHEIADRAIAAEARFDAEMRGVMRALVLANEGDNEFLAAAAERMSPRARRAFTEWEAADAQLQKGRIVSGRVRVQHGPPRKCLQMDRPVHDRGPANLPWGHAGGHEALFQLSLTLGLLPPLGFYKQTIQIQRMTQVFLDVWKRHGVPETARDDLLAALWPLLTPGRCEHPANDEGEVRGGGGRTTGSGEPHQRLCCRVVGRVRCLAWSL